MIGHLRGTILSTDEQTAILDVDGVGYEVSLSPRLLARLAEGDDVELVIETLVAETYIRLVGFETQSERRAFRLLQTVQGVGAKAAISILNVLSPAALLDAVAVGDKTAVSRAQGVGPKLAQRIVTELKTRTGGILDSGDVGLPQKGAIPSDDIPMADDARRDAIAALVGLGYDESAALRAVRAVPADESETVQSVLTAALKGLSTA
ncbi:Holliday junction branch migration protein RuvA [Parvularcula marina]|uniref:Holliday junction branch migration protein RuvA n=1 Tax=Parvularcula marina TaxID=2292771 RepID=UPI003513B447